MSERECPSGCRRPSAPRRRSRSTTCRHGKARAVALRLLEADAEVLAHPVHGEAEVELALVHGLAAVLHLPRLRRALRDHVEHEVRVEAGLLRERDAFGEPLHEAGDADLVHHLGELSRARGTQQRDRAAIGIHRGLGALERAFLPAAHHRELAVLGARLAPGDRRVDEVDALLLRGLEDPARGVGRRGRVVDEHRALLHAGERAVLAQGHLEQIVVVAHADHHEVAVLRRGCRRGCRFAAVLLRPTTAPSRPCGCTPSRRSPSP